MEGVDHRRVSYVAGVVFWNEISAKNVDLALLGDEFIDTDS